MAAKRFDLSATVARSIYATDTVIDVSAAGGRSFTIGPISWPSGLVDGATGEYACYLALEFADLDRCELRRRVTYASGTKTRDIVECRLAPAGADSTPYVHPWNDGVQASGLPADVRYLRLGWLEDAQTVVYMVAAGDGVFREVVRRTGSVDLASLGFVEIGLVRLSGDVVPASLVVERVYGGTNPNPDATGGGGAGADSVLHFDGLDLRVFPSYTDTLGALLVVARPASVARTLVPVAQSRGSRGILDTFNRTDGALGADWGDGGGTAPTIVSNAAVGSTGGTNTAIWAASTPGVDAGAYLTVTAKPANPPAIVYNALRILVRAAGTGGTLNSYILSVSVNTSGTVSYWIQRMANGSPSATAMTSGVAVLLATNQTLSVGDALGVRIVGTTLQAFRKPSGGTWGQIGGNVTDSSLVSGGSIGFQLGVVNGQSWSVDDFGGGAETLGGTFPTDLGGRYMRLMSASDSLDPLEAWWWDGTLAPPAGFGAGTIPTPPEWVMAYVGRDPSTGVGQVRIWNAATNEFTHIESAGAIAEGAAITESAARLVIGGRQPQYNSGDLGFDGDIAAVVVGDTPISRTAFEALVSDGMVQVSGLDVLPGAQRIHVLTDMSATDQILDRSSNAQHELTGQRTGTLTVTSDPGGIPVMVASGTPPPSPAADLWVPDATIASVTDVQVTPESGSTGEATVTLVATEPVAATDDMPAYTPHASPYVFSWSTDGTTWVPSGFAQASAEKTVVDLPLNTTVYLTGAYRDDQTTPLVGGQAPSQLAVIQALGSAELTEVDEPRVWRPGIGQWQADWLVPPADEGVTAYHVWIASSDLAIDYNGPPAWSGAGTPTTDQSGRARITTGAQNNILPSTSYWIGIKVQR